MLEPDGPKRLCAGVTGDETWLYFYDLPNKRPNQMWVVVDGKRPVVFGPHFESRKQLFSIFPNTKRAVMVDIDTEVNTQCGKLC